MKEYFIHLGQQEGPFTIEQLRSRNLSKETPVWYEGLNDWSTIGEVPELRFIVKATPPPFKKMSEQNSPIQNNTVHSEYQYQLEMEEFFPERRKVNWGTILLVTLVTGGFIALLVMLNSH